MNGLKLKKFTAATLAVCAAGTAVFAPAFAAFAEQEPVSLAGLGCSVNVPCGGFVGEKPVGSVFDSAFISSRLDNALRVNVAQTVSSSKSSSSIAYIVESYRQCMKIKSGEAVYKSAQAVFGSTIDYKKYPNQFYYFAYQDYAYCTYTLPEYSSNIGEYIKGLDKGYAEALDNYFSGEVTAEQLFSQYGTHVVMTGVYGRRWVSLFTAVSATTDLSKYQSSLKQKAEKAMNGGTGGAFDISGVSVPVSEINIFTQCSPRAHTLDEFKKSGYVLMDSSSDGLVPLWKLLPEKWSGEEYAERLESDYGEYAKTFEFDADALIESRPVVMPLPEEPSDKEEETKPPEETDKGKSTLSIVLLSVGAGLMAAGAAVMAVFAILSRRKGKAQNSDGQEQQGARESENEEKGEDNV